VSFADDGLLLGRAKIGGVVVDVRMPHHDRSRHTYALGATGTGKSVLLYNMAVQDMKLGHGFVVIDPHGDLYDELIAAVPPERKRDLVLIDPDDDRFCPGLNPLDFNGKPDMVVASRAASDMLDVFSQLYDMKVAGGPMFEEYFRNCVLLAVAGSRGGPLESDGPIPTLASIVHVLRDRTWREQCLSRLDSVYGKDAAAQIHQFFKSVQATTGDHSFANFVPYVSVKLTRFTTNATLRRMFCAGRRTVDFRQLIDDRKIVLVNLSKGDLGGSDSRIIGMLLTKYFFHAALSRSDIAREARTPFYLYLDEFQNFVATDIPEMLAEARKYGLHMVLANQTLGQLTNAGRRETLDAVLGNVATKLCLRVGQQEASTLEAGFAPYFDAQTLTQLPDRHVLCRLQSKGQPTLPFVFETLPPAPLPHGASTARTLSWAEANLPALVSREIDAQTGQESKSVVTANAEAGTARLSQ
jgi:type IV secretory pathway TraG/TraD family ATPase VirD4